MPYWRLSGVYFFYFAILGVVMPFWSPYLGSIGFDPVAIGQLTALMLFARIASPLIWGWVADRSGRHVPMMRLATLFAWLGFAWIFFAGGYVWTALIMLVFGFFWHASLPLIETIAMDYVRGDPGDYGRVRWWGSLGFIVIVLVLGQIVETHGLGVVPFALLAMLVAVWFTSLLLPVPPTHDHEAPAFSALLRVLRQPMVMVFFLACILLQISHGPYYTFYTVYLKDHGFSDARASQLWAFAVVVEVAAFLAIQYVLRFISARAVFLWSFALTSLRWVLIGAFPELSMLIVAQVLHAVSFGSSHAICMQYVHRFFTGRLRHSGQALYGSLSFGVGGALGSLYSGYTWKALGGETTYYIAAGVAVLAFLVALAAKPAAER